MSAGAWRCAARMHGTSCNLKLRGGLGYLEQLACSASSMSKVYLNKDLLRVFPAVVNSNGSSQEARCPVVSVHKTCHQSKGESTPPEAHQLSWQIPC